MKTPVAIVTIKVVCADCERILASGFSFLAIKRCHSRNLKLKIARLLPVCGGRPSVAILGDDWIRGRVQKDSPRLVKPRPKRT